MNITNKNRKGAGKHSSYLLAGLTAAIVVAASATLTAFADGLPDGYTRLPCISASGNCQIKTGYTPNPTDKIVMVWTPKTVSGNQCLWCARANTASRSFSSFAYGAKVGIVYNSTTFSDSSTPASFDVTRRDDLVASTRYTIIADGNAKTLAVTNAFTGAEVVNCSWDVSDDFTVGSQLCLFASHGTKINSPGNYASHYIYSFKVYDAAGNLKLDLVPAKDSNGNIGLYDTVAASSNFKTKSNGDGSLTDELLSMTYSDDATLDDDLTFDGVVTVEEGKTLNLNGHKLTVYSVAGDGTITAGLQDLTSPDPDGERVTHTGTFYGGSVGANLFNDNYARTADGTHRIIVTSANLPISVTYDFGADSPQKVDMYKLYCGEWAGNQTRGPKSWTFEGTDDTNGTWTVLHSQDDEPAWQNIHEARTYSFANSTAYRFYRITFTASRTTYLEAVQMELFDSTSGNAAQGELHIAVPEGMEITNSTVTIHGNVKLVKEGKGTFVSNKQVAYYGGNLISEGTLKAMPGIGLPIGSGMTDVQVETGAFYDFNGANTGYIYHFKMNGGTLTNTGDDMGTNAQIGNMTLMADSSVEAQKGLGFRMANSNSLNVDLAGHTLSVSNDATIAVYNATFSNGVVRIVGSDGIPFHNGAHADTATLDITGMIGLYDVDVTVSNLYLRSGSVATTLTGANYAFKVSGTFKTETDDFPFVTMMDGSVLDLKDREGAFNAVSTSSNSAGYRIKFASGATVTIDVAGRTLAVGDQLIAWDEIPQNVTFQFDAATAVGGVEPVVTERGLLYGYVADTVEQAWWTGAAGDGNIANSTNWLCKNVLGETVTDATPSAVTHIYLEGSLPTSSALTCRLCTLTNATLAADCDLRALGSALEIANGATINLNGHKFYVSSAAQIGTCTVRDVDPVDLTSPDTTPSRVTSIGEFYGSNGGKTTGANLFNNNYERVTDNTHRIIVATNNLPVSVAYDFGEPTLVDAYRIWTGPIKSHTSRLPMRWKIEGSNDGADWVLLDYRKDVTKYGDVNGHRTYSFANMTAYNRYRITFEAAQWNNNGYLEAVQLEYFSLKATQGELHIDTTGVSGEVAYSNLSLAGNMRLVKEGAGTIRLAKKDQTHIGGVEVLGGTVLSSASSATSQEGELLGERGSDIVVRGNNTGTASAESGVVDFEVKDGYTGYRYILDGGALHNPGLANITDLRLDTNSWLKLTATTPKNGTNYIGRADSPSFVDLSGHTLSATVDTSGGGGKTLYLYNVTVDDGLVNVVSGGWFGTRGTVVATNACVITHCAMDVQGAFLLRDYRHLQENSGFNRGAGIIDVYGTFSMVYRLFHGARLHDGSTIDLATDYVIAQPLPTVAMFAASQEGDKTLRFEPGATIGVKLGNREVAKGTRVISWDEGAEEKPDSTVKFVFADPDRKCRFAIQSDGLYYYPPAGFMLIVR